MSRAKDLLRAGLDTKPSVISSNTHFAKKTQTPASEPTSRGLDLTSTDLESVLKVRQPQTDRTVKRTFEMRESHVDILDKVVKKAKTNGKRITQSDALQFILNNWNERLGNDLLE